MLYERAIQRAKEMYLQHALAAAEARGDVGPRTIDEILPEHVERQERIIDKASELLTSWGIDVNKLKLALALTDIAKADPAVTFTSLLSFKARQSYGLPETAVRLAMHPVGIELVEVIQIFDRIYDCDCGHGEALQILRQLKGLSNVLLHAEAGRLMVAETIEILSQTQEDLLGESSHNSSTRLEAYRLGAEVADQITGHDSFRAGFGKEVMPDALGSMIKQLFELTSALPENHRPSPLFLETLGALVQRVVVELKAPTLYPPSQNMEGFILQILDRLEALEVDTQLRYVKEGMAFQGKSLSAAIAGGIEANYSGLRKIQAQLLHDIETSRMSALDKNRILTSPFMSEFESGLCDFEHVLTALKAPSGKDGNYTLEIGPQTFVSIATVTDLEVYYPVAFKRKVEEFRSRERLKFR